MKFFTLGCRCGCPDPLIRTDEWGNNEAISVYRTKEQAQVAASEITFEDDKHPVVLESTIILKSIITQ